MDWITFTKQQVENDALPSVCMVCGEEATRRVNKTFSYTPEWVGFLYLLGFLPGLVAAQFTTQEMRVSCPLCTDHQNHWRKLTLVASMGWFVSLPLASIGFLIGMAIRSDSITVQLIGLGIGAAVGLIPWLGVVIYLVTTRVKVLSLQVKDRQRKGRAVLPGSPAGDPGAIRLPDSRGTPSGNRGVPRLRAIPPRWRTSSRSALGGSQGDCIKNCLRT